MRQDADMDMTVAIPPTISTNLTRASNSQLCAMLGRWRDVNTQGLNHRLEAGPSAMLTG